MQVIIPTTNGIRNTKVLNKGCNKFIDVAYLEYFEE